MTWSLVGTPTTTEVTTNNPFGVLPTGTQNGDLIVAWCAYRNIFQFTQPGGWTAVVQPLPNPDALTSGGTAGIQVFWIQRGASAPLVQFGWSGGSIGAVGIIRIAAFRSSIAGTLIAQPLSGGAPWTPADISNGLIGWYDANDASTMTFSGANLTQWRDKSAAANHATPFSTGPTQAVLDSKNALLFNSSGLHTTTAVSFNDFTVAVVFRALSVSNYERLVDHNLFAGWWVGRQSSLENWGGGVIEPTTPWGRYQNLVSTTDTAGGANQLISKRTGAAHTIHGNSFLTSGVVSTAATASNIIGIGGAFDEGADLANSIIAEILIWNRALPLWEQVRLEGYLGFKWGIWGRLSFGHLHRQIPPVTGLPTQSIFQTTSVVAGGAVSSIGGIVPTNDGALVLLACAGGDNGTWTGLSTANIASGNWTALDSSYGTEAGPGISLHAAYYIQTTAADTGNAQATLSADGRNALALVSFQEFTNETSCRPVGTNITSISGQAVTGGSTVAACSASFSGTSALAATGRARTTWSLIGTPTTAEIGQDGGLLVGTLPAGTQDGDLLVAILSYRGFPATAPAGWNTVGRFKAQPDLLATGGTATAGVAWLQRGPVAPTALTWAVSDTAILRIAAFRPSVPTLVAQPRYGGSLWTPANISTGLVNWYDSADVATLTFSGANITQWNDKSPAGDHAVRLSSGPTTTVVDNKTALVFAASASAMRTGVARSFSDLTAVALFDNASNTSYQRFLDSNQTAGWWLGHGASGFQYGGGVLEATSPFGQFTGTASVRNFLLLQRRGANQSVSANAGTVTAKVGSASATASQLIGIGATYSGFAGGVDSVNFGELLVWNRALPEWEMERLEGYLANKWTIQQLLPAGHPYKQLAPVSGADTQSVYRTLDVITGGSLSSIPGVTPPVNDALLILAGAAGDNGTWSGLSTANISSGNWTALGSDYVASGGSGTALTAAYYVQDSPAATGNAQATLSVDARNALAIISFQGGVAACSAAFSGSSAVVAKTPMWSLVGVTTIEGTGSITGTLPAGTQTGDLLVAMFAYRGATGFGGSGWNLVGTGSPPGGDTVTSGGIGSLVVYWLQHGATAPALSWFTSGQVGILRLAVFRPSVAGTLIAQPRVGGVPWSPSDISTGLTSWFDSSDAATLTFAGANVSVWGDKSPAGSHAFPFSSGPTITIVDSKPALIFAGAASALHTTTSRSYGDLTAAVFFKRGTDEAFQRLLDANISQGFWLGHGGSGGQWGGGVIEPSSPYGQYMGLGFTDNSLILIRQGDQHTVAAGSLSATKTGSASATQSQVLGIGATYFGATGPIDEVTIGEILIWTRALPDWERDRLEGYIAHKWNLRSGLSSSHQFRNTGPVSGPDTQSIYRPPALVTGGSVSSTVGITPQDNDALLILAAAGGDNGTWSGLSTANIGAGNWSALGTDYGTETGAGTALTSAFYVQGTPAPTGAPQVTLSVDARNTLGLVSFQLLTNETSTRIANGGTALSASIQAVTGGTVVACSATFSGASNFGPNDFGVASCSPVLSGVSILNPSTAIIAPCSVAFDSSSSFNPAATALLPPVVACSASFSGGTGLVSSIRGNWALIGTPTTSTAVASGAVTGTLPTGTATGDLIVAWINYRGSATFTTPAGWTLVGTQATNADLAATNGIAGIAFYWIQRGASAPALVWNRTAGDLGQVRIAAFRPPLPGNVTQPVASVAQTSGQVASGVASTIAGVTPPFNNCLLVLGLSGADNGTWTAPATANIAAASWTALGTSSGTNTGADGAIHGAYTVQGTAAATGNAQATLAAAGQNALALVAFQEPPLGITVAFSAAGATVLSGGVSKLQKFDALLSGSSAFVPGTAVPKACSAGFSGGTALAAVGGVATSNYAIVYWLEIEVSSGDNVDVSLSGSSALAAGMSAIQRTSTAFSGSGNFASAEQALQRSNVTLSGSSAFAPVASYIQPESGSAIGSSALSAGLTAVARSDVTFSGAGLFSGAPAGALRANALLAGASALTATGTLLSPFSGLLTGASALAATLSSTQQAAGSVASFSGASALGATAGLLARLSTSIAGSSAFAASSFGSGATAGSTTGTSTMVAGLSIRVPLSVSMTGLGTFVSFEQGLQRTSVAISGSSVLTPEMKGTVTRSTSVAIAGTSDLIPAVRARIDSSVTFSGTSLLVGSGAFPTDNWAQVYWIEIEVQGASASSVAFNGTSAFVPSLALKSPTRVQFSGSSVLTGSIPVEIPILTWLTPRNDVSPDFNVDGISIFTGDVIRLMLDDDPAFISPIVDSLHTITSTEELGPTFEFPLSDLPYGDYWVRLNRSRGTVTSAWSDPILIRLAAVPQINTSATFVGSTTLTAPNVLKVLPTSTQVIGAGQIVTFTAQYGKVNGAIAGSTALAAGQSAVLGTAAIFAGNSAFATQARRFAGTALGATASGDLVPELRARVFIDATLSGSGSIAGKLFGGDTLSSAILGTSTFTGSTWRIAGTTGLMAGASALSADAGHLQRFNAAFAGVGFLTSTSNVGIRGTSWNAAGAAIFDPHPGIVSGTKSVSVLFAGSTIMASEIATLTGTLRSSSAAFVGSSTMQPRMRDMSIAGPPEGFDLTILGRGQYDPTIVAPKPGVYAP